MKILSFEESSILRKFLVFFLLVSVVPLGVLFYLYVQLQQFSDIHISIDSVANILLFVILGIVCGYWAMRKTILGFIETAKEGQRVIAEQTTLNGAHATITEGNETQQLHNTFSKITAKLEEDRRNLENAKKTLHAVLTKISVGLSSNQNINGFLHLIVETATDALGGKVGLLFLLDNDSRKLSIKSIVGAEGMPSKEIIFSSNEGMFAPVIAQKKAFLIQSKNNADKDVLSHFPQLSFPIIAAPLLVNDAVLGVLAISGKNALPDFSEEDLSLLYNMALQAGVAINNDEIRSLANIDPLTSIFNYRHMSAVLDYETMRLKRYPGNLSLIIFDVDGFKTYNDTFGHPQGDLLLKILTDAISKKLRSSDVFCRYGGDEFAVILPQTSLPGAAIVAQKIKETTAEIQLKNNVTLSIGGAEWMHPMTRHELLVKADKALYRAKQQGKDKILLI